jgi:hypothetical protein
MATLKGGDANLQERGPICTTLHTRTKRIQIDTGEKCRANRRIIESCFMNHLDESLDEGQNDPLSA